MEKHLALLRDEHLQLQLKYSQLQKEYDVLEASVRSSKTLDSSRSFVAKLISNVAHLYDKDLYSDITIHCDGHQLRGHRFLIATRTDYWGDLSLLDKIDLEDMPYNVGCTLLKWFYTDQLDPQLDDQHVMDVLVAAAKYKVDDLRVRCESILVGCLDIGNCVKIYQFADSNNLNRLRDSCTKLLAARWNDFNANHFSDLSAPLLYRFLKGQSTSILHSIIRLEREDVLFLYYLDHSSELEKASNAVDENGIYPLELALDQHYMDGAKSLIAHQADVNRCDVNGRTFIIKAIEKGQTYACKFLSENGAEINTTLLDTGEGLLHVVARSTCSDEMMDWLGGIISSLDVNAKNKLSQTALLSSVIYENKKLHRMLLHQPGIDVTSMDAKYQSPVSVALFEKNDISLARQLVALNADLNTIDGDGNTLLHRAVAQHNVKALQFLCEHKVDVDIMNDEGFTALHLALRSKPFLEDIFRILLKAGSSLTIPSDFNKATALHFLVDLPNSINLLEIAIDEQRDLSVCTCDDNGESPLARAVFHNHLSVAEKLLQAGCDVNETDHYGSSLLMRSFAAKLDAISVFLLSHGARVDITSKDGESCLELAVKYYLPSTVKHLCASGVNLNERNALTGLPPLWIALENGDFDIAKTMAEYGCDVNGWARSDDGICSQTMLHRAIDLNMHDAAIFLIESGCDVNAVKRYYNESLDDHQTPLHSCITWNLNDIANALIRMGASLTAQDSDGNTPVHIAIKEENSDMIDSLLSQCDTSVFLAKDRHGLNCFALAIQKRNDRAVRLIAERSPQVYLQTNRSGENLLHMAVRAADLESVLLLLGMQVDVNICVNNSMRTTALHICAQSGNEMIMRNLILAGASVNATSSSGLTPLHVAAYSDHAALCTILIENGADVNIVDKDGNTALHSAVSQGSVAAANVLLLQSDINARLRNKRHQTPLILAATCSSFSAAVEILQMFISVDPDYPVDSRDVDGNTLFLLSYMAGNAELCRAALGYTVCLAVTNNYGVSVFSYETPTKQLLFSLLDNLEKEPKWADGDFCSECEAKFNITMRKHHCRHCGRLVCSRCSEQTMPILKYGLEKAVRICQICFDVLTMGPTC